MPASISLIFGRLIIAGNSSERFCYRVLVNQKAHVDSSF